MESIVVMNQWEILIYLLVLENRCTFGNNKASFQILR